MNSKSISNEELRKIVNLSGLRVNETQFEKLVADVNSILAYVKTLEEVDTKSIPEMAHVQDSTNVMRTDEIKPSMKHEDFVDNAPDVEGPFFKVPIIVS